MRRMRWLWIGVVGLALGLAACGGGDDDVVASTTSTTVAGTTTTVAGATTTTSPAPSAFDVLLEAARVEAAQDEKFVIWIPTPREPATHERLIRAFEARYDLPTLDYEWVGGSSPELMRRLRLEVDAGVVEPSVFNGGNSADSLDLGTDGLMLETDWAGLFSDEFPDIADTFQSSPPELLQYWIGLWDAPKVLMWNTDFITEDELPNDIEDFTKPEYKGILAAPAPGFVLDQWVFETGFDEIITIAEGIRDNEPVYTRGSVGAMNAVGTGQAFLTYAGTAGTVERFAAEGQPVAWRPMDRGIPMQSQLVGAVAGSSHPNLAQLFSAWFATSEGQQILVEEELVSRANYSGAVGADVLSTVDLLWVDSIEKAELLSQTRLAITELFLIPSGG